nr:MAG TPA: hypothetical protein [Caudoviricetes sp.]
MVTVKNGDDYTSIKLYKHYTTYWNILVERTYIPIKKMRERNILHSLIFNIFMGTPLRTSIFYYIIGKLTRNTPRQSSTI